MAGTVKVTLIGENLTSHVITLTPILAKILTNDAYNCWPLLLRKSVEVYNTVELLFSLFRLKNKKIILFVRLNY